MTKFTDEVVKDAGYAKLALIWIAGNWKWLLPVAVVVVVAAVLA